MKNTQILNEFLNLKNNLNLNELCIVDKNKIFEIISNIANHSQNLKNNLDNIFNAVNLDIQAMKNWDPASKHYDDNQILSIRVGLNYLIIHRLLHEITKSTDIENTVFLAELIAKNFYRSIDIHPQATIGNSCALDHAHGLVIGATVIIGNGLKLYHGITLGGTGLEVDEINENGKTFKRRHPKIGNDVTIGMGSSILGPCYISDGINIGAGVRIVNRIVNLPYGSVIIRNESYDKWLIKLPEGNFEIMNFEKIKTNF